MKFKSDSLLRCAARIGKLTDFNKFPDLALETPLFLMCTRGGSVPHFTKDTLKMLTPDRHLLAASLPTTLTMVENVKHFDSLADYAGLKEYPFFFLIEDPAVFSDPGAYKKGSILVWTKNGRQNVTPEIYMDMMEKFSPDIYVSLCDGSTDEYSPQKRLVKAVDKSSKLFKNCLQRHLKSSKLHKSGLLGAIEGGYDFDLRKKSISGLDAEHLLGYMIDGLHTNSNEVQHKNIDAVGPIIEHCLNSISVDKLRVLPGSWNPITILDLVDLGIDVFDSSFPYLMSEKFQSLNFLCDCCHKCAVDLTEKRHADEFEPICTSCECLSCKNHTKAYIHHLITTKELLGSVLIMTHNLHIYMKFFNLIRHHIKNQTFQDFKTKMQIKFQKNDSKTISDSL